MGEGHGGGWGAWEAMIEAVNNTVEWDNLRKWNCQCVIAIGGMIIIEICSALVFPQRRLVRKACGVKLIISQAKNGDRKHGGWKGGGGAG